MTRTVSSVLMALFAALVTVPQSARSEIHDPAFLAALDENAQLYVADWNAASNAFVNYRFVGAWRQSEGRAANTRACAIAGVCQESDIVPEVMPQRLPL